MVSVGRTAGELCDSGRDGAAVAIDVVSISGEFRYWNMRLTRWQPARRTWAIRIRAVLELGRCLPC